MVKICVLRESTVDSTARLFKSECSKFGLDCNIELLPYEGVLTPIHVASWEKSVSEANFVVVWQVTLARAAILVDFSQSLNDEDLSEIEKALCEENRLIINAVRSIFSGPIIWLGLDLPLTKRLRFADYKSLISRQKVIEQINAFSYKQSENDGAFVYVDINHLSSLTGKNNFYDIRSWKIAKILYTNDALRIIVGKITEAISLILGASRKCLIVDCDNTLWGGILGEDGLDNILLNDNYPGSEYKNFQRYLVKLVSEGFLIALCSRNDEQEVFNVINNHPDMVLSKNNIVAWRINYLDKINNIAELTNELNLGFQSIVFIDDSNHEIELIKQAYPEILAIHVDPKNPSGNVDLLVAQVGIDKIRISEYDLKRTKQYQEENERRLCLSKLSSLGNYYASLGMRACLQEAQSSEVKRLEELYIRTNQFNLSGLRPNFNKLVEFRSSGSHKVYSLQISDKFGDLGIVGSAVIEIAANSWTILNLALSCRALGRGIEDAFIQKILRLAKNSIGIKSVTAVFNETPKNRAFSKFYIKNGFSSESNSIFSFNLDTLCATDQVSFIDGL